TDSTVDTIVKSYIDASIAVYNNSDTAPDTVWVDLSTAGTLASTLTSSDERTVKSVINEALTDLWGQSFRFVTVPRFQTTQRIVGASSLVEGYENTAQLLRASKLEILGEVVAYYGYGAFFM